MFPFWAIQPIFHIYDIWYYICPPGIIQIELPKKDDKYNNFINIKTKSLDDISEVDKSRFVDFIQQHFLREKHLHYAPKAENIWPYMEGLEGGSTFISFYNTEDMLIDTKTNNICKTDKILGTMVSYPLQVVINNGKPYAYFNIYYVDYLCVHSDHRNKSIAPQLIQTHNYHHRHRNPNIQTCLFKREGHFTAAIPLCVYKACGYNISSIYEKNDSNGNNNHDGIPPNINFIEVSHKNMSHLIDFIKTTQHKFKISISPSLANISSLIKTENVFIYLLIQGNIVLSAYYFKKQCSYIIRQDNAKKTEILTCFASITSKNVTDNIFINGFKRAIRQIVEKYPNYSELMIECKSDNVLLNNKLSSVIKPIFTCPCAYYFYNFAYAVYNPEETFILI